MDLFEPVTIGALHLSNRIAMAPLTRLRADLDGSPNDLLVEYYRQRASMGLIVTEGTWPVAEGRTWVGQPGIETDAHRAGWRRVTEAVHDRGGQLVMQVMHGGRVGHPSITGTGRVVAPSPVAAPGLVRTRDGSKTRYPVPHELTTGEIADAIDAFARAAQNARLAGLDGVQVHGANGYLVHQFLSADANQRTDAYGGSPDRRARFAVEVVTAVAGAIGADRTALRLSPPHQPANTDAAEVEATYLAVAEGIAALGLAFLTVLHPDPGSEFVQGLRRAAGSAFIPNTGFETPTTRTEAEGLLAAGLADAVSVGRAAIANPDLVERWRRGAAENTPDPSTYYAPGPRGYTDYPALAS